MQLSHHFFIQRTISRDLLLGLTLMLIPIMLLRGVIEYRYLSTNMRAALERHADASADDIAMVLQEPLFVMNNDEVRRLAATYVASGRLAGIRIVSAASGPLVESPISVGSLIAPRQRAVRWQGEELGLVELWFDDTTLTQAKAQLVRTLALLSFGIFFFGIALISFYLRLALTRPLARLLQRIREMARGDLAGELPPVPQQELNQIMSAMNTMSRELESATSHLRESNARYQSLVDNIPLGINLIDSDYRIVMSNATMGRWFAKEQALFIGQHCYREFEKRDQACSHCPGRESMTTGAFAMAETEGVKDDGSRFSARIRTVPIGAPERPTGFIEVVEDITDARRAEEEKAKVAQQLVQAQKMESIGTLAGGIAHDFNNILSGIIGFTDLALLRTKEESPLRSDLMQVRHAGERATELVRQILTFSRQQQQERQPLRLAPIIKEALKLLRASIPSTIEIRQEILSQAMVLADPTQIHQLVMNLCTNAYHAMAEHGGVLDVSLQETEIVASDLGKEGAPAPGRYVRLTVSDTGCGMSPELLARIFEPYFTTKEQGKGTGLGLAVVHGIVKDHQGRIEVESEPGRGTSFTVDLPLAIQEQLVKDVVVEEEPPLARNQERVMVVDDEETIRELVGQTLSQAGYRVELFSNGLEAWQALSTSPQAWDLVVTDQTMPGMTGSQLAVRAMEIRPDLPVILCSGYSSCQEEESSLTGVTFTLQKPIGRTRLLTQVATALER